MRKLVFLKNEFEVKTTACDLLDKVTFGQAEAICYLLDKLDELDSVKEELEFTRKYIHDNGMEFDLLSKYNQYCKSRNDC